MTAPALREGVFLVGFSLLLTHELDAVARSEWRVLPLLEWLPDDTGFLVFVLLHVPLFVWLLSRVGYVDLHLRRRWQRMVAAFLVIHGGLHLAFSGHAHYDFHATLSRGLIFGSALFGAAFLLMEWRSREPIS